MRRIAALVHLPLLLTLTPIQNSLAAGQDGRPDCDDSRRSTLPLSGSNGGVSELAGTMAGTRLFKRFKKLKKKVLARESSGKKITCAMQIMLETQWLVHSTTDLEQIEEHIKKLERALKFKPSQLPVEAQSSETGAWGSCYDSWFFKVVASFDHYTELADRHEAPPYPPKILDRINSPEKLRSYLEHLLVSHADDDGVDRRRELNEILSVLLRMILRDIPVGYSWAPGMKEAIRDFVLNRMRDPVTGIWGAWYQRDGRLVKTADLSITFHVLSYLDRPIDGWPKILQTVLSMENGEYPQGFLIHGSFANHNDLDAIDLFRRSWPEATAAQRDAMRKEIHRMLEYCLSAASLDRGTGEFRMTDVDQNHETAMYFGAAFLGRIGFFDPAHRFWTDESFPEAESIRALLVRSIRAKLTHAAPGGGAFYRHALKELGTKPPFPAAAASPAPTAPRAAASD